MPKITLVPYSITVKERNSQNNYVNLDDINGKNFFNILNEYLNNLENELCHDEEDKKTLIVTRQTKNREGTRITGVFEIGQYGYQEIIKNIDDYETLYIKDAEQVTCKPFYYLFHIPNGSNINPRIAKTHGVLLLQQFGGIGIKSLIADYILNNFRNDASFESFTLEIRPFVQKDLMIDYLEKNGQVKKITLIGSQPPAIIEDRYYLDNKDKVKRFEFSFYPSKNNFLDFFKNGYLEALRGEKNINDLMVINGFEANDIKAEFNIDGKSKTVRLSKSNELTSDYEITDDERLQLENGHPTYDSINIIATEYLNCLIAPQNI